MVIAGIQEEVLSLAIPRLSDIIVCPEYETIWNEPKTSCPFCGQPIVHSHKNFERQYAFGICRKNNTLVTCAMYPTFKNECDKNRCPYRM
jgi:hypothetical protein